VIGRRIALGALGAAASFALASSPRPAFAADADGYTSMTPIAPRGPRVEHAEAPTGRKPGPRSPGNAFLISGGVTALLGAAQVPIGVALLGAKSECALGVVFISQCTQSDGAHVVGVYMMASGALGVLAGGLLIGVGVGENRARRMKDALSAGLAPTLAPAPGGGTATWSF
jgi:hypothetical protein